MLAGTTVLVSLLGLKLSGLPDPGAFGFTTAIAVLAVMFTALLLVPAVGSLFRKRLQPRAVRRGRAQKPQGVRAERWARRIGRPATAVPARRGVRDARARGAGARHAHLAADAVATASVDTTTRRRFDLISAEIGAGANTPLLVVVDLQQAGQQVVATVTRTLRGPRTTSRPRRRAGGLARR